METHKEYIILTAEDKISRISIQKSAIKQDTYYFLRLRNSDFIENVIEIPKGLFELMKGFKQ